MQSSNHPPDEFGEHLTTEAVERAWQTIARANEIATVNSAEADSKLTEPTGGVAVLIARLRAERDAALADAECWRSLKHLAAANPYASIAHGDESDEDESDEAGLDAWEVYVVTGVPLGDFVEDATTAEEALRLACARSADINGGRSPRLAAPSEPRPRGGLDG